MPSQWILWVVGKHAQELHHHSLELEKAGLGAPGSGLFRLVEQVVRQRDLPNSEAGFLRGSQKGQKTPKEEGLKRPEGSRRHARHQPAQGSCH